LIAEKRAGKIEIRIEFSIFGVESYYQPMKFILLMSTIIVLIVVNGCAGSAGVDHGEHPGDLDHGDTMQK
jgi:hypothetical protein